MSSASELLAKRHEMTRRRSIARYRCDYKFGTMPISDWYRLRDWRDAWLHVIYNQWQDEEVRSRCV